MLDSVAASRLPKALSVQVSDGYRITAWSRLQPACLIASSYHLNATVNTLKPHVNWPCMSRWLTSRLDCFCLPNYNYYDKHIHGEPHEWDPCSKCDKKIPFIQLFWFFTQAMFCQFAIIPQNFKQFLRIETKDMHILSDGRSQYKFPSCKLVKLRQLDNNC